MSSKSKKTQPPKLPLSRPRPQQVPSTAKSSSPNPAKDTKSSSNNEYQNFQSLFLEAKLRKRNVEPSRKYVYLYSENYQNIEKLLNSTGKTMKARSNLPEYRLANESLKKKIEKRKLQVSNGQKSVAGNPVQCFRRSRTRI